jgi:hypothetical protein
MNQKMGLAGGIASSKSIFESEFTYVDEPVMIAGNVPIMNNMCDDFSIPSIPLIYAESQKFDQCQSRF